MFVTEGCSRYEHQFDPDRTLWRAFEVVEGSRIFVARTAPSIDNGPRTLFISTADGLADAISEQCYGSVQHLYMIDCLAGPDLCDWTFKPVAQLKRHVVAILGGGDSLEAVLRSGETFTIVPTLSRRIRLRTEVVWECREVTANDRSVDTP